MATEKQYAKLGIQYLRNQNNVLEPHVVFSEMGLLPIYKDDAFPQKKSALNQLWVKNNTESLYPYENALPIKHILTSVSDDTSSYMTSGMSVSNTTTLTDIRDGGYEIISHDLLELTFACPTTTNSGVSGGAAVNATGVRLTFANNSYAIRFTWQSEGNDSNIIRLHFHKINSDGTSVNLLANAGMQGIYYATANSIVEVSFCKRNGDLYLDYKESNYTNKSSYVAKPGSRTNGTKGAIKSLNLSALTGFSMDEFTNTPGNSLLQNDSFVITHLIGDGSAASNWGKFFIYDTIATSYQTPSSYEWQTLGAGYTGSTTNNTWATISMVWGAYNTKMSGSATDSRGGSYPIAVFSNVTLSNTNTTIATAQTSQSSGLDKTVVNAYIDSSGIHIQAYGSHTYTSTTYYSATYSITSIQQEVPVPSSQVFGSWHQVWSGSSSLNCGSDTVEGSNMGTTTITLSQTIGNSYPLRVYVETTHGNSDWVDSSNEPVRFSEEMTHGTRTGYCDSNVWAPDYVSSTSVTITAKWLSQEGNPPMFPTITATIIEAYY